jgi:hypothetical protein
VACNDCFAALVLRAVAVFLLGAIRVLESGLGGRRTSRNRRERRRKWGESQREPALTTAGGALYTAGEIGLTCAKNERLPLARALALLNARSCAQRRSAPSPCTQILVSILPSTRAQWTTTLRAIDSYTVHAATR